MSLRCGCYDEADDIVFGPNHQCTTQPALSTRKPLPPLVPSWVFVVPAERPYETTLDTSELED
jgi:hypothetical protein